MFLAGTLLAAGCASQSDLKRVHDELGQRIAAVDERATRLEKEGQALQQGAAVVARDVEKNKDAIMAIRKVQASLGADITELRDQVQQLGGSVEKLQRDVTTLSGRAGRKDDEVVRHTHGKRSMRQASLHQSRIFTFQ